MSRFPRPQPVIIGKRSATITRCAVAIVYSVRWLLLCTVCDGRCCVQCVVVANVHSLRSCVVLGDLDCIMEGKHSRQREVRHVQRRGALEGIGLISLVPSSSFDVLMNVTHINMYKTDVSLL